ncbi:MAG: DUF6538 domain-containing protein [Pseudomonadota bacterium]
MLETKSAPYTFVKQGIFFFLRRLPSDLSHHYNASRIMYSLRTRSPLEALRLMRETDARSACGPRSGHAQRARRPR